MPFGMKNSPATFQRLINNVTAGLRGCEAYIDDVIIHSETWKDHVMFIKEFLNRLSNAKLTVNLSKSAFGCAHVVYLGHIVGQGQIKPVSAKIQAISNFPVPKNKRELMRFLGMAGYYRKFYPNFSSVTQPLSKKVKFLWSTTCQKAFDQLKMLLETAPVLSAPDFSRSS